MISCKLQGGIGNQMFQIAATYALALRNNDTCAFNFDECYTPNQGFVASKYQKNLFSGIFTTNDVFPKRYNEPSFGYNELPYADGLLLNGYFQSEKYFEDFKDEIMKLFTISSIDKYECVRLLGDRRKPITSVHVRRGDYLKNSEYHKVLTVDYYKKAMELIGDSNFIFISDDIEWVKENFKGDNIIYSDNTNEVLDFTLMTMCNNNIIANSSFSWWGAYLNPNIYKKVIAPLFWFGPLGPKEQNDIIPKNWILVP